MSSQQSGVVPVKYFSFSVLNRAGSLIGLQGVVHPDVVSLIGITPCRSTRVEAHIGVLPDERYQPHEKLCRRAIQHAIDRGLLDCVNEESEYLERGSPEWTGGMTER
ncbi:hypothetical protein PMO31116_04726 [Pandoraea morbifera]|uniref:Uncharacterized protein n=1 Tax=Pandoraea morbifera TaxID=2508300 RepID=A0A5E4YVV4_9BURK|nr:hypothetical protein PMO31116_04726 [Pandoraea morbifera]